MKAAIDVVHLIGVGLVGVLTTDISHELSAQILNKFQAFKIVQSDHGQ